MNRLILVLITACLVTADLVAPSVGGATTAITRAAGGSGGVPYHVACGEDEVLVGLVLDATTPVAPMVQWLESAYPICAKVGAGGTWADVNYQRAQSVGGWSASQGGRGPAHTEQNTRLCPRDSAVIGFQAYAGTFLDRLQLLCRKMMDSARTTGAVVPLEWFPDPVPDIVVKIPEASCASLRFEMRPGETLDKLVARIAGQIGAAVNCLNPVEWKVVQKSVTQANPGPHVLPRAAGGPAEVPRADCPQARPATGIYGKAGAAVGRVVDSLGLKCVDEAVWRPGYHFSPRNAWMNDPAGLVFVGGTYHLHYQAIPNPSSISAAIFGADKMTWGHATSRNLLKWDEHRAVFDANTQPKEAPYTGSAVVLNDGEPPCACSGGRCIAAVFTRHLVPVGPQRQVVTTSCQRPGLVGFQPAQPGREIPLLPALPDPVWQPFQFRDPKLVWYEDPQKAPSGYWLMAVAAGDRMKLYRSCSAAGCSRGVTTWEHVQDIFIEQVIPRFRGTRLVSGPFFETPDLLELPVQNEPGTSKWVLLFAKGWMPPFVPVAGQDEYSESWYQVLTEVDVQGKPAPQFQLTGPARRLDAGPDFYAPQTWFIEPSASITTTPLQPLAPGVATKSAQPPSPGTSGTTGLRPPAPRRIMAGWQNNWRYAHELPTSRWKGHLSVPRELSLIKSETGQYALLQQPIRELASLRNPNRPTGWQVRNARIAGSYAIPGFSATQFEARLTMDLQGVSDVQVHVRDGQHGGKVVVGWRSSDSRLYLDRRAAYIGGGAAPRGFAAGFVSGTALPLEGGRTFRLHILVDRSSVEVFAGDGRVVMSGVFFPDPADRGLRITSTGGTATIVSLDLDELRDP